MERVNGGFLFEAKTETNGVTAVLGKFKSTQRGTKRHIAFTIGIDTKARVCMPWVSDLSNGFIPMDSACTNEEELKRLVAGNKSFYFKVGDFGVLASGLIIVHDDGQVDSSKVDLYVPSSFMDSSAALGGKPALVALLMTNDNTDGHQKMNPAYIRGYKNYIESLFKTLDCSSKLTFFDSLMKNIRQ